MVVVPNTASVGWRHRLCPRPALRSVVIIFLSATVIVSTGPPALAEPTTSYVAPTLHVEPAAYTWQAPNGALPGDKKEIALTFDDGPSPYTPQVLAVLERYHVPATFFEIGEWVAVYPQYTRELVAGGYPVENHTWSHPDLATIPAVQVAYQVARAQDEIRSVTGQSPACVRPPYDDWDTTVLDQIASDGLTTVSYSVDSRDWALPGTQAIVDTVLGAAFPGAIVDMHDGGGPRYETVEALPQIITGLWAKGYTFVAICGAHRPSASTLPVPHAAVLSVRATSGTLAAGGGTVAVTGRVEHASSCQLQLLSRQSFPVVYSHNPTSACHDGNYSAHVTIGANPTPVPRVVAFDLIARNSTSGFTGRFYVLLAAAPPAIVLSARATPGTLAVGGGTVAVAGKVKHATSCQLELLSHQSFPVVYSHNPKDCLSGAYSARVVIGANPSPISRTVSFALVARNKTSSFTGRFYVVLAAPPPPPTTTTATVPALRGEATFGLGPEEL